MSSVAKFIALVDASHQLFINVTKDGEFVEYYELETKGEAVMVDRKGGNTPLTIDSDELTFEVTISMIENATYETYCVEVTDGDFEYEITFNKLVAIAITD